MAGLLAYAAEGAVAGAGKGIEQAGGELLKDQVNQGLMKLQNQYATERQQAGFGHEEGMQTRQENFQREQVGQEIAGRSGVAHFQATEAAKRAAEHEAGATTRANILAKARVDSAGIRADAAKKPPAGPKPWVFKTVATSQITKDGPVTTQKPLMFNPNNGSAYAQVGDKYVRWDSEKNAPAYDAASFSRAQVDPGEIQRLYANPYQVVPDGNKNAGLTNLEVFEQNHHYLPAGIGNHLTSPQQQAESGSSTPADESNDESGATSAEDAQAADDNAPAVEPGE